jgi:uncharacterized protein YndB with AHSA1/START domain
MIILSIIVVLIAIPLVAAALLSKTFSIETSITIYRPIAEVFNYLKILKNADYYNKWVMTDPGMKKEYLGTDGTVGFVYKWDSQNKNVGKGEQEIIGISEGEKIDYEIRFIKPFEAVSNASLVTKTSGNNQTEVSWSFSGIRNYPMRIFHFLFNLKKMLTKDLHTGLVNLKNVLEK